jgi:hypothetical protein
MSGSGVKLFVSGEIAKAVDINEYLMDQVIARFPTEAARDAAFGDGIPVSLGGSGKPTISEGRFCYLDDINEVQYYDGAAWQSASQFTVGDGTITEAKLAANSVTSDKIAPGVIIESDVADNAVTGAKIASGAVTSAKLGVNLDLNGTTEIDEILETVAVNTNALTGTVNIDAKSGAVHYFTSNSSADWVWNFRGDGSTTLNSMMDDGQSITFALFATNDAAFEPTSLTVDTTGTVSVKWFGGNAYPSGNASSVDCYTITIVKTAANTYTAFASQSKFA